MCQGRPDEAARRLMTPPARPPDGDGDASINAGGAKSLRGEALTEYMIILVGCSSGLDGLYP